MRLVFRWEIDVTIQWQVDGEGASFAGCALEVNPASMGFNQVARNAKPQSHSLLEAASLVASEKWLEHLGLFINGNPIPIILHTDQQLLLLDTGIDIDGSTWMSIFNRI